MYTFYIKAYYVDTYTNTYMYIYILITFAWLHAPRKSQHPTVFGLWSYRLGNRRTPTKPLIPLILFKEIGFFSILFLKEASGKKIHQLCGKGSTIDSIINNIVVL